IRALEPVLETVAQAQAAEEKKAALAEARARVMAVLDRALTVTHMDGPNFAALVQCLTKAREIRQAAQDPKAFDTENTPAFLESMVTRRRRRRFPPLLPRESSSSASRASPRQPGTSSRNRRRARLLPHATSSRSRATRRRRASPRPSPSRPSRGRRTRRRSGGFRRGRAGRAGRARSPSTTR